MMWKKAQNFTVKGWDGYFLGHRIVANEKKSENIFTLTLDNGERHLVSGSCSIRARKRR